MVDLIQPENWLPLIFWFLMGLAILIYVVLDGYDLGVGILLGRVSDDEQKDMMIASIGPFWDANETWLVLGVGILLVAFPLAHGVILGALYIPVLIMLLGLILRGVAFDFRAKVKVQHKPLWNYLFCLGSVMTAGAQGVMLGHYITGFADSLASWLFALFVGFCLIAGYAALGATWLIMKTEGTLQTRSVHWARSSLWLTLVGVIAISVVTPCMSQEIFDKWFSLPHIFLLAPIPLITASLFIGAEITLKYLMSAPQRDLCATITNGQETRQMGGDETVHGSMAKLECRATQYLGRAVGGPAEASQRWIWVPFALVVGVFILAFHGIAYSLFPYLVPNQLTLWQGAASSESLHIILIGVIFVLPTILAYTAFSYRVFWGKTQLLRYD